NEQQATHALGRRAGTGTLIAGGSVGRAAIVAMGAAGVRRRPRLPEFVMPDAALYPYETRLDILYPSLTRIDVQQLVDACTFLWYYQTLCRVDRSVVGLVVVQGEYHWHEHAEEDEFFYVVEGRFLIDLEDRTVELLPRQGFVVPRGVRHRPRAPERTVILMVEGAGIVPTGS